MVRPTRAARAHDRSRGGKLVFVLSLTVSHACGMPSPLRYLPRMGAVSLRRGLVQVALKQHDEKIRELVMTVVGQEPGNVGGAALARRCSRLSSRMTCCCASTTALCRRTTLSEGAWGCRPLSVVRWQPSRARRGGVHGGRQARGATRCRPGPAALCTPSNPSPNRTRPLIARPNAGWSHSYRARGAWPNSNPILTLNLPIPNPT